VQRDFRNRTIAGPPAVRPRGGTAAIGAAIAALAALVGLAALLQWPASRPETGGAIQASSDAPSDAPARSAPAGQASDRDPGSTPAATLPPTRTGEGPPPAGSGQGASAIVPGTVNRTSIDLVATYDADVELGYDARTLRVDSTATVTNRSGAGIDRVELNTITGPLGNIRLRLAEVDGAGVQASVNDQTIVVPLGGVLPDDATAAIRIKLRATLPSTLGGSNWMFTRTGGILQANRWLPWVGLHRPFDRPNHGDPFFTALSPFARVTITTDRQLRIATPGRRVAAAGLTQTFEAENVRDFPIVASPHFSVRERVVGSWRLRAFVRDGFPTSTVLDQAADALSRMNALAGPYPYSRLTIAQTAGGYALEGPGMIWIPTGMSGTNLRWNVYHEVAHQWFYGIVGSDHARDPFADEAVATHLGQVASGIWRTTGCPMRRLDLSIYRYSESCYFGQVYVHGANLLRDVRSEMEPGEYFEGVRDYVADHYFEIGSTRVFLDTLQQHTGHDLEPLLAPWFPELY
jgi:hypothetical protein